MTEPTDISSRKHKDSATFTVDGRPFTTDVVKQQAEAILRLAGLDPAGYDLAEVRPGGAQPKKYADADEVHIKDGDAFVTIRQSAEVA